MGRNPQALVDYTEAQLGRPYWYATYGKIASYDLYLQKKKQYPQYYTATDFSTQYGQRVHDCVGLIKGFMWSDGTPDGVPKYASHDFPDVSANGLYQHCKTKGTIDTMPDTPGVAVFFNGHVGVYIGGGKVNEARGHKYGVVETKFSGRGWTHWGLIPGIEYGISTEKPEPKSPVILRRGDKNATVRKLQEMLLELGYTLPRYGADGDFGVETEAAVVLFQQEMLLDPTGVVDEITAQVLIAKCAEDDDDDADTSEAVKITTPGVWNVRTGAGTSFAVKSYAHYGDDFPYIATAANGWVNIRLDNGADGWVSPKCCTVK